MPEIKLKPCPFCGSKKIKKVTAPLQGTQMFICPECGADVCFYGAAHEPKATKAWNRRVENETDVEVEPVRHGKWMPVNVYCNHAKEFKCSACGDSVYYEYDTRFCEYDFCPNCGAKMDGGNENDT